MTVKKQDVFRDLTKDPAKPLKTPVLDSGWGRVSRWELAPGQVIHPHAHHGHHLWVILSGRGELLPEGGENGALSLGMIVDAPSREPHGIRNSGSEPLVFLSITIESSGGEE